MGAGSGCQSDTSPLIENENYGLGGSTPSCGVPTQPPKPRGPMDKFATSEARQSTLNSKWKQDERKEVCRKIGRFIFARALPFNTVNDPYWAIAVEGIANYGPGFKPPSMHELRTWVLKDEVDDINRMMEEHKKAWKEHGCSIMSDGWTDGKNRVLINFLVNSPAGTWFLKSVDASDTIKNADLMFNYLDGVIDEIGEANVVQVITDNASNYVAAGSRLMEKRKKLYWTPCAAHCIDLMLEDIAKLAVYEQTLKYAREVVKFIYGHTWVLALMRFFTKNNELLRPAVTRFATAYLTLQSLYKQKQNLIAMFSSDKWCSSSWAWKVEGIKVRAIVLFDPKFWSNVAFCIKTTMPLVVVLREVDSEERPAMGYIYELMDSAKEKIAFNCANNAKKYTPIWNKIDARWTPQLHRPLHAAGYYLNPQLRYRDNFSNVDEVKQGLHECMDRMLSYEERLTADIQLDYYDQAKGDFGTRVAVDSRMMRSPANWWMRFGGKMPELTKFAIRVLSLTCSASGCERNWSTFESIHTKKRNRLEHKRLNALVYVKYNTKLRERSIKRRQNIDPILVDEIDSDDEWIAEKEDPVLPIGGSWLEDEELFDVDAIRTVPITPYERSEDTRSTITNTIDIGSSSTAKKRKVNQISTSRNDGGRGKSRGKAPRKIDEKAITKVFLKVLDNYINGANICGCVLYGTAEIFIPWLLRMAKELDAILDRGEATPAVSCIGENGSVSFLEEIISPIYKTLEAGGELKLLQMSMGKPLTRHGGIMMILMNISGATFMNLAIDCSDSIWHCKLYFVISLLLQLQVTACFDLGWPLKRDSSFLMKPKKWKKGNSRLRVGQLGLGLMGAFKLDLSLVVLAVISILDVLLTFGAYSTARAMAISRIVIRFFWFGLSSAVVVYLYVRFWEKEMKGFLNQLIFGYIFSYRVPMPVCASFLQHYLNFQLVADCRKSPINHSFNFSSGFIRVLAVRSAGSGQLFWLAAVLLLCYPLGSLQHSCFVWWVGLLPLVRGSLAVIGSSASHPVGKVCALLVGDLCMQIHVCLFPPGKQQSLNLVLAVS
ncbi:hypothetical protein RHMOL_Rhmol08G0253400 [Rhododendron molle]|uniref:Uncharacterized protein n=1 Tax=Rhododendron molle TaxID=49168 RepID=A0ACC0MSJ4_RHOML|nr:hypothetical protein RHMOL_Rhmol08G0253400 [Rhododendron molle]